MRYRLTINFILLLMLALTNGTSFAQNDAVTLVVGGQPIALKTSPVLIDGSVHLPLEALSYVGAKADPEGKKRDGQKVGINPSKGDNFHCRARLVGEELMIPIMEVAPKMGVITKWDDTSKTLKLRAKLTHLEFDGSNLRIGASYPVTTNILWWKKENRLIIDIPGSQKSDSLVLPTNARTGTQNDGETTRIVFDFPSPVKYLVTSGAKVSETTISISGYKPGTAQPIITPTPGTSPVSTPETTETPGTPTPPTVVETPPANITDIDFTKQTSRLMDVKIAADAQTKCTTYFNRDPDQLIVDISKASLAKQFDDISVDNDILEKIHVEQRDQNTVRLTMDLTRFVIFDVKQNQNQITISLQLPRGAGGSLSRKIIVIDPGHGGHDGGAKGLSGSREKDSNLAMAKRVQKILADAGICALLTRQSDAFVNLSERPAFAARHSADLFISIHSNSCPVPNKLSGIETWYHAKEPSGKEFANCLQSAMMEVAGMKNLGIKSDTARYKTGFAVLRGTSSYGIAAALVEVGFINCTGDECKIIDPDFQQRIAAAMVKGIKHYVEGKPRPDIRRTQDIKTDMSFTDSEPAIIPMADQITDSISMPKRVAMPTMTGPVKPGSNMK